MNILYCGDAYIEDGVVMSVLSLANHVKEPLNIYIMTVHLTINNREYKPVSKEVIEKLDETVKRVNPESSVTLIDSTRVFESYLPTANLNTRFTPCCMLRLYADRFPELPDKILYLDNDVICRRDCTLFYHQDITDYEISGVLDYYGSWFFRRKITERDYINSGVLLMNLNKIRETGLLKKCRKMCRDKQMFMPDQSALNKLADYKKLMPERYNDQRYVDKNTVFHHFTTSFRFFPWVHTVSAKPWQLQKVHKLLKMYDYDELHKRYMKLMEQAYAKEANDEK